MNQRSWAPVLAAAIGLLSIGALLLMVRSLSEPPAGPARDPFPRPEDDAGPRTTPSDYLSSLEFTPKVNRPFAELPEPEAPAAAPAASSLPPAAAPAARPAPAPRPKPRLSPIKSIADEPPTAASSAFLPAGPPPEKKEAARPAAPPAKAAPPPAEPAPRRQWRSVEGL